MSSMFNNVTETRLSSKSPPPFKKPPLNMAGSSDELFKKKGISHLSFEGKYRSRANSDGVMRNKMIQVTLDRNGFDASRRSLKHRSEIEFDEDLFPKAGTKEALTKWVIDHQERTLTLKFLLFNSNIWTSESLFELLDEIYKEEGDENKIKILDFLLIWINNFFFRDFQRSNAFELLEDFLPLVQIEFPGICRRIKLTLLRSAGHEPQSSLFSSTLPNQTPKSKKLRRASKKIYPMTQQLTFHDILPSDFAEQLTLLEFEFFKDIDEREFLAKDASKPNSETPLGQMVQMFSTVSIWVAWVIVSEADLKERVNILRQCISIAEHCYELHNFNSLMALTAGMNLTAVQRLEKTWALVGHSYKASFDKLSNLMTTKLNFQSYRSMLSITKQPIVPYIGLLLRDVIHIEEGNVDYLDSGYINFDKILLMGSLFMDIKKYQKDSYNINLEPSIRAFIKSIIVPSEEEIYSRSKAIEEDVRPESPTLSRVEAD